MSELVSELKGIYEELQSFVDAFNVPAILKPLEALEESAIEAGKAWGHSWLGYLLCGIRTASAGRTL